MGSQDIVWNNLSNSGSSSNNWQFLQPSWWTNFFATCFQVAGPPLEAADQQLGMPWLNGMWPSFLMGVIYIYNSFLFCILLLEIFFQDLYRLSSCTRGQGWTPFHPTRMSGSLGKWCHHWGKDKNWWRKKQCEDCFYLGYTEVILRLFEVTLVTPPKKKQQIEKNVENIRQELDHWMSQARTQAAFEQGPLKVVSWRKVTSDCCRQK